MSISWACCQSNMGVPLNRSLCPFFSLEDAENDPKAHLLEEERRREECIFNGKSKEENRRQMNREEGETKQGAEKMALFFIYSLSLVSPFPLSFRNEKTKRKNYEKEKSKERNRRDRPRG